MEIKKLTVNGKTFEYHINRGENISIEVAGQDGEKNSFEVLKSRWNESRQELVFHTSNKVYCASVFASEEASPDKYVEGSLHVSFSHSLHTFTVASITKKKKKKSKSNSVIPATKASLDKVQTNGSSFKSPLAGRVTKVLVSPGEQVKKGQPLVVIESMKMENELCADRSAFIKTIFINEGNVVQQNHVLLDFENKRGEENAGKQSTYEKESVQNRRSSQRA